MHGQPRMPDLETRQRHVRNVQAACEQLEMFTTALDDLIAQLESEMRHQPYRAKHSLAADNVNQFL
jgi:hypothetical protein